MSNNVEEIIMPNRYETIAEVLRELNRRQFNAAESVVRRAMARSGLHVPIDNYDLLDLINELQLKRQDRYIERVRKKLESDQWQTSLIAARCKIGLPIEGISKEEARALHVALLEMAAGTPKSVTMGTVTKSVVEVWTDAVREGRLLCRILKIDPDDADKIYASFVKGSINLLIGVRKLLNPEGVLKVGDREIIFEPSAFDRLIGHLLWGLPLSPIDIVDRPSVNYRWERLPDGSGRLVEGRFSPGPNTAAEDRALRKKLVQIKRIMHHQALLQMDSVKELKGKTWQERWEIWTEVFPDFSYSSPHALRKAVARAKEKPFNNHKTEPSA